MMDEGEYDATEAIQNANGQNIVQHIPKIPEQPSAPPRTPPTNPVPLPKPETPRITHTCQPPGYYRKLNDGEYASSATTLTPKNVEHSSNHWALAAAEAEPKVCILMQNFTMTSTCVHHLDISGPKISERC
jgi:hypothetical protein